jgi:hypothetical protein
MFNRNAASRARRKFFPSRSEVVVAVPGDDANVIKAAQAEGAAGDSGAHPPVAG